MFPYTDKENEWLSTTKHRKPKTRKSNKNRQRRVTESETMVKRGPYWFLATNRFYI